jgi:hypothetical protein
MHSEQTTGRPETTRPSLRSGWSGLWRALPGESDPIAAVALRITDVRSRLGRCTTARLGAGFGRQDHTLLPYANNAGRVARLVKAHEVLPALPFTYAPTQARVHRNPARVL